MLRWIKNGFIWIFELKLVVIGEWKDKRLFWFVSFVQIFRAVPGQVSESPDFFKELSL